MKVVPLKRPKRPCGFKTTMPGSPPWTVHHGGDLIIIISFTQQHPLLALN